MRTSFICGVLIPLVAVAMAMYPRPIHLDGSVEHYFDESLVRDELYMVLTEIHERIAACGLTRFLPPADGMITSWFGWRRDPFHGARRFHAGIDIAHLRTSAIRAARAGMVRFAGEGGGYGNLVIIDHDDFYSTRYGHLCQTMVRPGDEVHEGQVIGSMGATGRATGRHLHFELRRNDRAIDPLPLLMVGGATIALH